MTGHTPATREFVVDRREGRMLVLVDDSGESRDVSASALPPNCRAEGAVLRVPVDAAGSADWPRATRDVDAERARLADAQRRLDALRRRDPGGDVAL